MDIRQKVFLRLQKMAEENGGKFPKTLVVTDDEYINLASTLRALNGGMLFVPPVDKMAFTADPAPELLFAGVTIQPERMFLVRA